MPKNQKRSHQPAAPDPGFVAKVEEIGPKYEIQPPRCSDYSQGFFIPPDQSNAFETRSTSFFRYRNGVLRGVAQNDPVRDQAMEIHDVATVFSQATSTDHLLTVPFDARTHNVSDRNYDWRNLGFEHKTAPHGGTYASLNFIGEKDCLPAVVPAWEKLIPQPYRYQKTDASGDPVAPGTTCAGLIGSLPLLLALVAFSARPASLGAAITTSRSTMGRWVPHDFTTGRQSPPPLAVSSTKSIRYTRAGTGRYNTQRPREHCRIDESYPEKSRKWHLRRLLRPLNEYVVSDG